MGSIPPLMTQLAEPSDAEDGVNARTGCAEKNFDTQRIPSLQPLVDESGADAIVGTHVDAQGSVRCGQVATKSTKNLLLKVAVRRVGHYLRRRGRGGSHPSRAVRT